MFRAKMKIDVKAYQKDLKFAKHEIERSSGIGE